MNMLMHILTLFAVCGFTAKIIAEDGYAFEVLCDTPKHEYRLQEPIAIKFHIKNISTKSVFLYSSVGSDAFTVLFNCRNSAIRDRKNVLTFFEGLTGSGLAHQFEFKSGETISGVRYLNQDKDFGVKGEFETQYSFVMNYDYPERAPGKMLAKVEHQGKLTIIVNNETLRIEDLNPILARWGPTSQQMREVMKALALIDDPVVIPLLVKYAREAPSTAGMAAIALRKFISRKDGLEALEALGREYAPNEIFLLDGLQWKKEQGYGESSVGTVYGSFIAMERFPNENFLKEQLASKNEYRICAALDYLLRAQQKANSAPLDEVERLQEHKNNLISETARKVLEKISKQKVKDDF